MGKAGKTLVLSVSSLILPDIVLFKIITLIGLKIYGLLPPLQSKHSYLYRCIYGCIIPVVNQAVYKQVALLLILTQTLLLYLLISLLIKLCYFNISCMLLVLPQCYDDCYFILFCCTALLQCYFQCTVCVCFFIICCQFLILIQLLRFIFKH